MAGSIPAQSGNRSSWNSWLDCRRGNGKTSVLSRCACLHMVGRELLLRLQSLAVTEHW